MDDPSVAAAAGSGQAEHAQPDGQVLPSHGRNPWANEAVKLVNMKDLAKPPSFDGGEGGWKEWRFRFEKRCSSVGY